MKKYYYIGCAFMLFIISCRPKVDPVAEAKNAAASICDCKIKTFEKYLTTSKEGLKSFDNYGFKTREDAIRKGKDITNAIDAEYAACDSSAQQKYVEMRHKCIDGGKEVVEKFDATYKIQLSVCDSARARFIKEFEPLEAEFGHKLEEKFGPLPAEKQNPNSGSK